MNTIVVNDISEKETTGSLQINVTIGDGAEEIYNLGNVEFKSETRVLYDLDEDLLFPFLELGDRRFANQGFYFHSLNRLLCARHFERDSVQYPVDLSDPIYCGKHPNWTEIHHRRLRRILKRVFKKNDNNASNRTESTRPG